MNQTCIICDSYGNNLRDRIRGGIKRNVLKCPSCGLIYLEPTEQEIDYSEGYRETHKPVASKPYSPKDSFNEYSTCQEDRFNRLKNWIPHNDRLLDIGCSSGGFLKCVSESMPTAKIQGIELNKADVEFCRSLGLDVTEYDVEYINNIYPDKSLGAVCMFHVLEHFTDPIEKLEKIKRTMKPRAIIIIEVPNVDDVLLTDLSIKEYRNFYFRECHNFYFSPRTLSLLMAKAGFTRQGTFTKQRYSLQNAYRWILAGKGDKSYKEGIDRPKSVLFGYLDMKYREIAEETHKGDSLYYIGRNE